MSDVRFSADVSTTFLRLAATNVAFVNVAMSLVGQGPVL
jgi:hypothetical protein